MENLIETYTKRDFELFDLLLKNGANPNEKSGDNIPILLLALSQNNIRAVELLLHYGAKMKPENHKLNFFAAACNWNCQRIVELLIRHGADDFNANFREHPLLLYISIKGDYKIIKLLIEHGANIFVTNLNGENILMQICKSTLMERFNWYYSTTKVIGKLEVKNYKDFLKEQAVLEKELIIYLHEKNLDFNQQNKYGQTALHFAYNRNRIDLVEQLLSLGANPNIKDKLGCSPYYYSVLYKNTEYTSLFFQYGGKLGWWEINRKLTIS